MCGFVGFTDLKNERTVSQPLLSEMTASLVHRGPDSDGYFVNGVTGLGFRRLSIIDLASGDQPIYSEDGSLVLLCNGEIYNYRELRNTLQQKGHVSAPTATSKYCCTCTRTKASTFLTR